MTQAGPIQTHGSGKLILAGEHAVVYGYAALAFAVDLGTSVRVTPHHGPTSVSDDLDDTRVLEAIHETFGTDGVHVELNSTLPIGRGMGSSASLGVALARAGAAWHQEQLTDDVLFERAMRIERRFHGNPSGVDVAVSLQGGVIRYTRRPPPQRIALPAPNWAAVVLDTGLRGDTAAMVAGVAARRPSVDPILQKIGRLVDDAQRVLHDAKALGEVLNENQRALQDIGVSSPEIERLVMLCRRAGAYGAKLSGAGGGGVVMALVDDAERLLYAAAQARVPATVVRPVASA